MQIMPTSMANAAHASMTTNKTAANTPIAPRRCLRGDRASGFAVRAPKDRSFAMATSNGCKLRRPGDPRQRTHGFASRLYSRFAFSDCKSGKRRKPLELYVGFGRAANRVG